MEQGDFDQNQQENVIGGDIQNGIPQQQDDPALIINPHYLPQGDLTITSNISFVDSSIQPITVPLTSIPGLFQQVFDASESNLTQDVELEYPTPVLSPNPPMSLPNIARYLAYIVLGIELDIKYRESILLCCQNYTEGTMEITPNGDFRALKQTRDGTTRRYTNLCIAIYFSISGSYYKVNPHNTEMIASMQSLMQDIYQNKTYTSVYTKLNKYVFRGKSYTVPKSTIRRWATTIPWHALMYNSQSPLTFTQFIDLYFKMYSISQGKILRYDISHSNDQSTQTIIPNSQLFSALNPPHMISSEINIPTDIPDRFITLMRYLMLVQQGILNLDDDEDDTNDNQDDIVPNDPESIDEGGLAS